MMAGPLLVVSVRLLFRVLAAGVVGGVLGGGVPDMRGQGGPRQEWPGH